MKREIVFFFISRIQHAAIARLFAVAVAAATKLNIYSNFFFTLFVVVVVVSVFGFACIYANNFSLCCVFVTCSPSLSHTTRNRNTLKQRSIIPTQCNRTKNEYEKEWKFKIEDLRMKWNDFDRLWIDGKGLLRMDISSDEKVFWIPRTQRMNYVLTFACHPLATCRVPNTCIQGVYCILMQCDCDGDRVCYALTDSLVATVSIIN